MSEFTKHIAALFPGPVNMSRYMEKSKLEVFFPFYHAVSDMELQHMKHLYATRTIEEFKLDMEFLLKSFTPVKMSEYLSGKYKKEKERPPMVLSFDDGLIQCFDEVMPILLEKGIPATFFLNNAFIDNRSMFYRFKVSLLIEQLESRSEEQKERAATILHCNKSELKKRIFSVSYVEREITDQVAALWEYSYDEYMRKDPVYLTSIQINQMIGKGFEFGSHGIDHPMFSLLNEETTLSHIQGSVEDLRQRYNLQYKYFAFPFTDHGVDDSTIDKLLTGRVIDAGFGTAGLKDDKWSNYFQRVPMELLGKDAKTTLRGELNRRRVRKATGRNFTKRK